MATAAIICCRASWPCRPPQANKAVIEQMKAAAARRSATEKAQAEELVAKLDPVVLSFTRKAGEAGPSLRLGHLGRYRRGAGGAGPRGRPPQDPVGRSAQEPRRLQGRYPAAPRGHRARDGEGSGRSDRGSRSCSAGRCSACRRCRRARYRRARRGRSRPRK